MNFFLVLNGRKLKNYAVIILTAFVTAWFIYIQNFSFAVFSSKDDGPKAFFKGKDGVALTFNIAWGDTNAEPIIKLLKEREIKNVTFFLSGVWAERHPHIVEMIVQAGFEIGILGYDYLDYEEIDDAKIRQDIFKAIDVFKKLNVKYKNILRAPNGHFDERFLKIADQHGFDVIHWSVNSNDWKNPGVQTIVETVSGAKNGDIILLHASDSAKQTAVALPTILDELEKKKLKLVTISELLVDGKAKTNQVQ